MRRIEKVVILVESPFNKRDYDRFGVEILQENGFEVEVWDFTPFLKPEVHEEVTVPDPVSFERYFRFFSRKEAVSALTRTDGTSLVICFLPYSIRTFPIFKAMTKMGLRYCTVNGSALPCEAGQGFKNKLKRITPERVVNKLFERIPLRYFGLRNASFALVNGGRKSLTSIKMKGNGTEIITGHSFDYDIYLRMKDDPVFENSNTAVFLDEYVPFHPDYVHLNLRPFCTAEQYYPPLCDYFDYMESEYAVEVIIAAHPRSHYDKHPDYFNGRRVIIGKTAELVRQSKIVLLHSSTAVNFVVLFKKPLVFLTSDRLNESFQEVLIRTMASSLGKRRINVDRKHEYHCKHIFHYDEGLYSTYKNQYIKIDGSQELPSWQIFADRIKET